MTKKPVSLQTLATQLGYEARLSADNSGDSYTYLEQDMDVDDLYDDYWKATHRAVWLSAYFQAPEKTRGKLAEVEDAAFTLFKTATRSAAGYRAYVKKLPRRATHDSTKRIALLGVNVLADAELDALVAALQKLKKGPKLSKAEAAAPRDLRNPALEKQIVDDPTDPDRYAVYADWLQERGDPRGLLIALDGKKPRKKYDAHFAKYADYFLGSLAAHAKGHDFPSDAFFWQHGFIASAKIHCSQGAWDRTPKDGVTPVSMIEDILAHPSGMFVHELRVYFSTSEPDMQPVIDLVATKPATLRSLVLGDHHDFAYELHRGDLSNVWPELARLRELVLRGDFALGATFALPNLTYLSIRSTKLSADAMRAIASAKLPRLAKLELEFGAGATCAAEALAFVGALAGKTLTHLALDDARFANELVDALLRAPCRKQLLELSLSDGDLDDAAALRLAASGVRFERLCVDGCRLSNKALAALAKIATKLDKHGQRPS